MVGNLIGKTALRKLENYEEKLKEVKKTHICCLQQAVWE